MMTMMTVVLRPRRRPLAQADVLAGVFGSTFVKTALQLGHARTYATLDTFPWCPLLRCYLSVCVLSVCLLSVCRLPAG